MTPREQAARRVEDGDGRNLDSELLTEMLASLSRMLDCGPNWHEISIKITALLDREIALAEAVEALRNLSDSAIVLSRDYLKAFERSPMDATIQGWHKEQWLRLADAHDKAKAIVDAAIQKGER